jgi:hypothetical protein
MGSRVLFRSFGTLAARTVTACALVATASWSTSQECTQAQVKPGRIVGEARFQNAQLTRPYLDANPAVDAYYSMPVGARVGWSYVAYTGYTPRNTWDQNDRVAAAFDLAPDVGLADTFDLSLFDLRLQDGALYAFGSRNPGTTLTHSCSGVRPVSEEPDGKRCDLSEAVVLLNVPVRLQGPAAGRLDATQPVWCSAEAWIQDAPYSGYPWRQAASPSRQFSLTDLTGPGTTIPLLVRSVAQITLGVSCSAAVATGSGAAGQPCFVISPPGSGRASLSAAVTFDPGTAPPPFVIPVQCTAGAVRGALDVVGHEIVASQVWLGRNSAEAPFQQTEPRPTGGVPRFDWRFDGFPQGSHAARAWAVLDGRSAFIRMPAKDGLYGRVAVIVQQTTNLGNTFVTRPVAAKGEVLLSDLGNGALASLSLGPLATQHWAPWESSYNDDPDRGDENPHSFTEAMGALRVTSTGTSLSGLEGLARAELKGGYDPTTGKTHLDYTLQLGGLSPMTGASDGSGAFPTPWDVSRLHLRFGDPEGGAFEGLAIGLVGGELALPAVGPASAPLTIPTQRACVARARLQLRIPPALGAIARPAAEIRSVGPHYGAAESSPLADASGHYYPDWYDASPPGPAAVIPLELPAGFYYQVTPSVEVTLTGTAGAASRAYLPSLSLPGNAPLRCGDEHGPCLRLGCGGTSYEALSVEVLAADGVSPAPVCLSGTSAAFDVRVTDTVGLAPSRVSYALDPAGDGCGPSPTDLCDGNCLANPVFTVTVTGLTLGTHRLVACAAPGVEGAQGDPESPSDGPTCYQSAAFSVKTVACPSDFRVVLDPGEADVAASDPRVAPNLVVSSASDCSASLPVTDDRPARFPPGTTTVHFAAGQPGSCNTRVTVVPTALSLGHQAAGWLRLFEPLTASSPLRSEIRVGPGPFDYRLLDHDNAVVARGGKVALTAFPAAGQPPATPTWYPVGLPTGPWRLARHPTRPFLAVLGRTANGSSAGPWAVKILQGTQILSTVTVPVAGPGLRLDITALGWSPDGRKLAVAGVALSTGGQTTTYRYVVHVWDTSSVSTPVGPTSTVAPAPQGAVVHEILFRAQDLLVATNRGLSRLDPDWHVVFNRSNYDMAIGPGGDGVVLATVEADSKARLVYRVLTGAGETREGPVFPKWGGYEVAFSADGRFAAISTSHGALKAVPVYKLQGLTATSSAVALVTAPADGTDPQFRR